MRRQGLGGDFEKKSQILLYEELCPWRIEHLCNCQVTEIVLSYFILTLYVVVLSIEPPQ